MLTEDDEVRAEMARTEKELRQLFAIPEGMSCDYIEIDPTFRWGTFGTGHGNSTGIDGQTHLSLEYDAFLTNDDDPQVARKICGVIRVDGDLFEHYEVTDYCDTFEQAQKALVTRLGFGQYVIEEEA